jgi:uncharacterized protein (TIRG00374 family)
VKEEKKTKDSKKEKIVETTEKRNQVGLFSRIKKRLEEKRKQRQNEIQKELTEEENKAVEEKLEEVNKEVEQSQKSTKKRKIWKIVFFILNIVIVVGILIWDILTSGENVVSGQVENYWFLFVVFLFLILILLVDTLSIHRLIYRKTLRSRWALSYKSMAIWRYYNDITPIPNGGQSFMISYLLSRDISGTAALSIPVSKLLFQNSAWLLLTIICLIISFSNGITGMVSVLSVIAFCFTLLMLIVMLTFSSSKRICEKVASWGIKCLVKIKILKEYDKYSLKVTSFIDDYQATMKEYAKTKFDIIYQFILNFLRYALLYSIPFFICCAFRGDYDLSVYGDFFVYTVLVDLATMFIPIPGGAVVNEITFAWLFRAYLGGSVFWPLLLWRFCDYYLYLLQGLSVFVYDTVYGNRKYRWVKKRRQLQEESQEFRKIQIENFRAERLLRRKKQSKNKQN